MNQVLFKRDVWADILKAIAILAVVIGHSFYTGNIAKVVYLFHLPLFFFVAGYLFNFRKYVGNSELLIANSAQRLLLPCVVVSLIVYDLSFWFSAGVLSVIYGVGIPVSLHLAGLEFTLHPILLMMWFLYCLFVIRLLLWGFLVLVNRLHTPVWLNFLLVLAVALVGIFIGKKMPLPWSFDIACVGLFFAYAGYCVHSCQMRKIPFSAKQLVLGLLGAVLIYMDWQYGLLQLNDRNYQAPIISLLGALAIIGIWGYGAEVWVRNRSRAHEMCDWLTVGLVYIGANSLVIMFVHMLFWEGRIGWWLVLLRVVGSLGVAELLARNTVLQRIFGAKTWKAIKQECASAERK